MSSNTTFDRAVDWFIVAALIMGVVGLFLLGAVGLAATWRVLLWVL
jgi:hypothetical protein